MKRGDPCDFSPGLRDKGFAVLAMTTVNLSVVPVGFRPFWSSQMKLLRSILHHGCSMVTTAF
jgi:hypothetical protein